MALKMSLAFKIDIDNAFVIKRILFLRLPHQHNFTAGRQGREII
jgi:hypothetical protein